MITFELDAILAEDQQRIDQALACLAWKLKANPPSPECQRAMMARLANRDRS